MSDDEARKCYQATPHGTLMEQLMNPCVAKSEREWAAMREIQRLNSLLASALETKG